MHKPHFELNWPLSLQHIALLLSVTLTPVCQAGSLQISVQEWGKAQAVPDAVLYLMPVGRPAAPLKPVRLPEVEIDQQQRQFVPYVTVLQTGTVARFPNSDRTQHHVYSFSPAKRIDQKLYRGRASKPVMFDQPGVVVLGCNIHDWMLGYVVVVDSAWFAQTNSKGEARISEIAEGNYDLMAWHPRLPEATRIQTISIKGNALQTLKIPLRLELPDPRPLPGLSHPAAAGY